MPPRRQIPPSEKLAILKQHLVDKVPISDLADRLQIQPSQVYTWQKQLFEQGAVALASPRRGPPPMDDRDHQIAALQAKLACKDGLLAELLEQLGRMMMIERSSSTSYDARRSANQARAKLKAHSPKSGSPFGIGTMR